MKRAAPCSLCGRPASYLGFYVPHNQRAHFAPVGKVRMIGYVLCRRCFRRRRYRKVEQEALKSCQADQAERN
jgi:hypothetical protein